MEIAIIGGGIVGLTTALSLNAVGIRATVYEAVDVLKPLGVGINLLPHAVRELTELGLLDELKRIGVEIDGLDYHMADGRAVWSEPRGLEAGYRYLIDPGGLVVPGKPTVHVNIDPDTGIGFQTAADGADLHRHIDFADQVAFWAFVPAG